MDRTLISEKSHQEIDVLLNLIPKPGTTYEDRKEANKKIRTFLPQISNDALSCLAITWWHQLSFNELQRRIRKELFTDLSEIFRLLECICLTKSCRSRNALMNQAIIQGVKISKSSSSLEIAELLRDYRPDKSMVCGDLCMDEYVCKERSDLDKIRALLISFGLDPEYQFNLIFKKPS